MRARRWPAAARRRKRFRRNQQLDGALSRLLVIAENYPQLRSNENFLHLQDEIAGHREPHRGGAPQIQRSAAAL